MVACYIFMFETNCLFIYTALYSSNLIGKIPCHFSNIIMSSFWGNWSLKKIVVIKFRQTISQGSFLSRMTSYSAILFTVFAYYFFYNYGWLKFCLKIFHIMATTNLRSLLYHQHLEYFFQQQCCTQHTKSLKFHPVLYHTQCLLV